MIYLYNLWAKRFYSLKYELGKQISLSLFLTASTFLVPRRFAASWHDNPMLKINFFNLSSLLEFQTGPFCFICSLLSYFFFSSLVNLGIIISLYSSSVEGKMLSMFWDEGIWSSSWKCPFSDSPLWYKHNAQRCLNEQLTGADRILLASPFSFLFWCKILSIC